MGGSAKRMKDFADFIAEELGHRFPVSEDLTGNANRFSMYKVGPILSVNHGIGGASLSVLLHELCKLMAYAKCKDPIFIRIGTCGGIGIEGGTVAVSNGAVDGLLRSVHELVSCHITGAFIMIYFLRFTANLWETRQTSCNT